MSAMKQVMSLVIDSQEKHNDFLFNRKTWFRPITGHPVLYSYTMIIDKANNTYVAHVYGYERNQSKEATHAGKGSAA